MNVETLSHEMWSIIPSHDSMNSLSDSSLAKQKLYNLDWGALSSQYYSIELALLISYDHLIIKHRYWSVPVICKYNSQQSSNIEYVWKALLFQLVIEFCSHISADNGSSTHYISIGRYLTAVTFFSWKTILTKCCRDSCKCSLTYKI